ncbi:hypothetical protein F5890DRAFT_1644283 [Lentinula detonsa]|nr:hypothetical protein F5890DRAFT_1644283 [Lentinula detonsa]
MSTFFPVTLITLKRTVVEQVLSEYIIPLPPYTPNPLNYRVAEVNETGWTDRFLNVIAFKFETELSHCHIDVFVDACVQSNGGLIDGDEENVAQKLNKIIELVSAYFPDPQARMKDDLKTFALKFTHKPRLDVDTDLKGLIKAQHDFIRRSEQNSSNITSSMTDLLRRSSLHINKGLTALP